MTKTKTVSTIQLNDFEHLFQNGLSFCTINRKFYQPDPKDLEKLDLSKFSRSQLDLGNLAGTWQVCSQVELYKLEMLLG